MTTPLYVMHAPAKGHNLLVFQNFFKIFFVIQVMNDKKSSNDFFIDTIYFVASRAKCVF